MNYIINYTVFDKSSQVIKTGDMLVKNKNSVIEAKVGLEGFLKRKHPLFNKLIIHSCSQDTVSQLKDLFGMK